MTTPISRLVWFMVFNVTFNNISVISWQSALVVIGTDCIGSYKFKYHTINNCHKGPAPISIYNL